MTKIISFLFTLNGIAMGIGFSIASTRSNSWEHAAIGYILICVALIEYKVNHD